MLWVNLTKWNKYESVWRNKINTSIMEVYQPLEVDQFLHRENYNKIDTKDSQLDLKWLYAIRCDCATGKTRDIDRTISAFDDHGEQHTIR